MILNRLACLFFASRLCSAILKTIILPLVLSALFAPPCRDFQLDEKVPKNSSESAEGDQESPNVASRLSLAATRPFIILRYGREWLPSPLTQMEKQPSALISHKIMQQHQM